MAIDLQSLFSFSVSPLELIIRGSVIYAFLFAIFRVVLRRDVGALGVADVLVLVLIADAAQNAMAGEYRSISDGLVLISTIIAWNAGIDWLAFRFPRLRRLIEPRPLLLVRDGRIQRRNLRREFITNEELRAKLREQGVEDLSEVHMAYLESDGEVSVLTADPRKDKGSKGPRQRSRSISGG